MKIKLLINLSVGKEHGMTKDRILKVIEQKRGSDIQGHPRWYVLGDKGERVGVLPREAEVIDKDRREC